MYQETPWQLLLLVTMNIGRVPARDCTAHTSPIATVSHGAESSLYSILGYSLPQCLDRLSNVLIIRPLLLTYTFDQDPALEDVLFSP